MTTLQQQKHYRPTWVEIDITAIAHNVASLRQAAGASTALMGIVKMDAYGHGLIPIARALVEAGVTYLGVACIDEAIQLRTAGIATPILILEAQVFDETQAALLAEYAITSTVTSYEQASILNAYAACEPHTLRIHIKIDTGMGRIGLWHADACEEIIEIARLNALDLEGIFTHFPCSLDEDKDFCEYQLAAFTTLLDTLNKAGFIFRYRHAANSSLIPFTAGGVCTMARPGLALYGIYPHEHLRSAYDLKPVLSFKTRIVFLKTVPAGRSISYGRSYSTSRESRIATVPVGYADGYPRSLSGRAEVLIRGQRVPVVGMICMDQMMIDITDIKEVTVGDEVTVIGPSGAGAITIEALSGWAKMIPYEILVAIGRQARECVYSSGVELTE